MPSTLELTFAASEPPDNRPSMITVPRASFKWTITSRPPNQKLATPTLPGPFVERRQAIAEQCHELDANVMFHRVPRIPVVDGETPLPINSRNCGVCSSLEVGRLTPCTRPLVRVRKRSKIFYIRLCRKTRDYFVWFWDLSMSGLDGESALFFILFFFFLPFSFPFPVHREITRVCLKFVCTDIHIRKRRNARKRSRAVSRR